MNEKDVLKQSVYLFMIGCFVFGILGILLKDISYLLGFILGYIINVIVFYIIIYMSDMILNLNMSTIIVMMMFVAKLVLYALGFYIAVKSNLFHLVGVFFGYLITKLSIYVEGYKKKGGE